MKLGGLPPDDLRLNYRGSPKKGLSSFVMRFRVIHRCNGHRLVQRHCFLFCDLIAALRGAGNLSLAGWIFKFGSSTKATFMIRRRGSPRGL
jgi:hypothetical protein